MNIWVKIGLLVIALHLLIGFGWLFYKLTVPPKRKNTDKKSDDVSK